MVLGMLDYTCENKTRSRQQEALGRVGMKIPLEKQCAVKTPFQAGLCFFLKMVRVSPETHWHEQPRTSPKAPPKSTSERAGPSCTGLFIARPLTVTGWFGAVEGS